MSEEVVQAFADAPAGETWTFTRASLEKHMKSVCLGIHAARLPGELVPKPIPASVKKDDVEYLQKNLLLTHADAEKILTKNGGSLEKAVRELLLLA